MERSPAPPLPDWLEKMVPFKRYRVPIDNYYIHVMEVGEGTPVVALHGNPTWGFLYRKIALGLGEGYRVIMPDLLGLGFSSKPRSPATHTLAHHADVMSKLFAALELRDYIFVGQDWGGPIGLIACARSAPPSALVLLNTVIGPPRPGFKSTFFHRFSRTPLVSDFVFRRLRFPQIALWSAQGDKSSIRGEVARAYRVPFATFEQTVAPLALARMVPDTMEHPSIPYLSESQEFVTEFDGPIEVVWGLKDPVLGGVVRYLKKILPEATFTDTDGGHFIQEEHPALICDAIRRAHEKMS